MEEGKASQSFKLLQRWGAVSWEIAAFGSGCSSLRKRDMTVKRRVRLAVYTCVVPSCSTVTDCVLYARLRYVKSSITDESRLDWVSPALLLVHREGNT